MLNIAILCNFYQAYRGLERLLNSIPNDFIQYFIGIDGCYLYHKERNSDLPKLSTDGSRELILQTQNIPEKILVDFPNRLEHEKRNKYLEICETYDKKIDVGIICDDDEFFIYPQEEDPIESFARFKKNIELTIQKHKDHNVFSIRGLNMNANPPYDCAYPRIFVNPGQMRYLQFSHYYYGNIYREKKEIEQFAAQRYIFVQYSAAIIKGIILAHSHDLRSKEYMKQREEYIEYLKRFEGLVQSYYFNSDQAHRLAMLGIDRNEITIKNKDEIIKKYL